jgi:hypothetical protein
VGGWYWWKSQHAAPASVAVVTPPPAETPKPSPVQEAPPPVETPPAPPPPAEPAQQAPTEKAKRPRKPKADEAVKTLPPAPAPVTPPAPTPPPVAAPVAPPPKPAPVITTPVMVSDALPFVMTLDQDVPADATDGQALRFTVTQPLQVGDKTVVAKGATVTGAVTGEAGKKFLGIGGKKLTFRLAQADAVDGRKLAVRAMAGKNQDGPTIRPFDTGKASKAKGYAALQGTTYIGYVDGDQVVAVKK